MRQHRNVTAHLLFALGAAIIVTEVLRFWIFAHPIEGGVVAIGAGFGFVGAYAADRAAALEGGGFIVNTLLDFATLVRTGRRAGRRSTDSIVAVRATEPTPPPLTWHDGSDEGEL